jgi:hypothetical protein
MDLWKNKNAASGGSVEWNIRYRGHNRAQTWDEFSEADIMKRDTITTPTLSLISLADPVDISIKRLRQIKGGANGATALVNYMNESAQAAEDDIIEHLGMSIFSYGIPIANSCNKPLANLSGLGLICAYNVTYAGVAVADAPTWQPNVIGSTTYVDNGTVYPTAGAYLGITLAGSETLANYMTTTHNAYLGKQLSTVIANCTVGADRPNIIVCNIDGYTLIQQMLMPNQRYPQDIGYGGFKGLFWEGIPVYCDRKCQARSIYVLNTDFLELRATPGAEITFDAFEKRTGTDVMTGMYLFDGQMICTSRRHQGAIYNLPTA